jgi:hypothetical protein
LAINKHVELFYGSLRLAAWCTSLTAWHTEIRLEARTTFGRVPAKSGGVSFVLIACPSPVLPWVQCGSHAAGDHEC